MTWKSILKNEDDVDRLLSSLGYKNIGEDERGRDFGVYGDDVYEKGEEIIAVDKVFEFLPSNVILHNGAIMSWQMGNEETIVAGDNKEDVKKIFDNITRGAESRKVNWYGRSNTLYITNARDWRDAQQEDSALGAEENYSFNRED